MNPTEIVEVLHRAPLPKPPAGLKERLAEQVSLTGMRVASSRAVTAYNSGGWLRRWWPALASAFVCLICTAVLTAQQMEIRALQQTLRVLPRLDASAQPASQASAGAPRPASARDGATSQEQELARLKELVAKLTAELAPLESLRLENERLRRQLVAPAANTLTPEEAQALADARGRALSVQCVNNMKQLGLAVRIWANDNNDAFPPDVLSMTNEMGSPKILVCPADTGRNAAADWSSYTPANCSYEYLGGTSSEPTRVMFRCPIHGNIGLCDGSVQRGIAKDHPESLVERDGKLYYQRSAQSP